jgi:FKBP-type peptidyl-prolyl cis-trans isomerase (trigger factor)
MEGFAEALIGSAAGDERLVNVKFPVRPSGPGAVLSGKDAVFDVTIYHSILYYRL